MTEPVDRTTLRAALEQRSADWSRKLRSDHPDEARYVVQQLIGPLALWFNAGLAAGDEQGMENVEPEDCDSDLSECGFRAVVTPRGLLNGLVAASVVAGAGFEPATFGL